MERSNVIPRMKKSSVSNAARVEFWLVVTGLLLGYGGRGLASENEVEPAQRTDSSAPAAAGNTESYEQTVKNSAPSFGSDELNAKMARLWSDVPDYLLRLNRKENTILKPAQLTTSILPVYPPLPP